MISSTARDLPEHRKEVLEACQRQGFFAERMEDLPAYGATAKDASLKMVDEAEVYVGVFAHRYGYIPEEDNPDLISVTEMEYNRAVETGKPRMIFIIDPAHPITIDQVEHGEGATKLAAFLNRVGKENIVRFFKSPTDLRAEVINSLSQNLKETGGLEVGTKPAAFHYVSDIPAPPETYIAHPYSLLQTHDLIGRRDELNLLTDWVAKPDSEVYAAHILSFVAIGGMGKSALTWKWFNDIAPEEMKPLAGRMWWSFYESDASFENFVIRTLAYVTRRTIDDVREMPTPNREAQLLSILDHEPHLIVMDGLERVLIAYARGDANRLSDTQVSSEKHERKTTDPRVGQFLKKLRRIKGSRILLSTRLHPAELETEGDDPLPGVFKRKLDGLSEDDALELWRAFGVSGSRDLLRPIFDAIERHPLLIQALAGDVKRFRKAPGNFEEWRSCNQQFDPASFPIVRDAMAHMMEYALQDLKESHWNVLSIIAAFRMPTGYPTLVAILVGDQKPCSTEIELDSILVELEDRGLVGWDRLANRYDLHPIVRGVVWSALDEDAKQEIYTSLHAHFELAPKVKYEDVNSIEDLTATIELYNTLIGLGRYDEAVRLFYARLNEATLYRLSSSHERVELLKLLFPDGLEQLPKVSDPGFQAFTVEALAHGYQASGQSKWAVPLYRRNIDIRAGRGDDPNRGIGLRNLSIALRLMGHLRESENAARRALVIPDRVDNRCGRAVGEYLLGLVLAARGEADVSGLALRLSLQEFAMREQRDFEGIVNAHIAQREIWFGGHAEASKFAARGWDLAHVSRSERNFIRAARAQGEAALGLGNLESAEERLLHALTRARCINHSEEELPSLTALAELRRRQGYGKPAREFLDDVWEYAERGPYPLFHADALNVLAQIERDAGNPEEAIKAATQAYRLAWCDGPPFAYHWGLIKAEKHLRELGAPLPDLPPFDESKFEPMPEVEIDPDDEFNANARRPAKRRESSPVKTVVRDQPKVGKNDPCPCDSGKKYKKCCGLD